MSGIEGEGYARGRELRRDELPKGSWQQQAYDDGYRFYEPLPPAPRESDVRPRPDLDASAGEVATTAEVGVEPVEPMISSSRAAGSVALSQTVAA